jgi:hypothetical protein
MKSGIYLFSPAGLGNEVVLFWTGGSGSKDALLVFLGMLLQIDRSLVTKLKKLGFEANVSLSCTWGNDAVPSPTVLRAIGDAWKSLGSEPGVPLNHFFETETK